MDWEDLKNKGWGGERRPDADCWGESVLSFAARNAPGAVADLLKEGAAVDRGGQRGSPPLHLAARHHPEAVKVLLDAGARPDVRDQFGRTPLMVGSHAALALLLGAGAQVDRVDDAGEDALMGAACRNDARAVRVLLDAGADASRKTEGGRSALSALLGSTENDEVSDRDRTACVLMLLDAGSDPEAVKARFQEAAAAVHPPPD